MQKKTGSIVLEQALESKLTLNDRGSYSRGRGRGRDGTWSPTTNHIKSSGVPNLQRSRTKQSGKIYI